VEPGRDGTCAQVAGWRFRGNAWRNCVRRFRGNVWFLRIVRFQAVPFSGEGGGEAVIVAAD